MNYNIKNIFRMGVIAAVGTAAMSSCTDTWDEHYGAGANITFDGTTMAAIKEKAPDFAKVIEAAGFDRELNSENTYTIWAPQQLNVDSLLELVKTDSAYVVDQFIKNHIARFSFSDNGTTQEIPLMSAKNTTMDDIHFGSAALVKGSTNISCKNGLLHLVDANINYKTNIYELMEQLYKKSLDGAYDVDPSSPRGGSLYAFLQQTNSDSLDQKRSVSRGVDANGEKIWVDSVVIRNNTTLKNVDALVYEEDSSYIALVPTVEAFQKRFNIYKDLLKFNPIENEKDDPNDTERISTTDSLQAYFANMFAMNDLFFNKNANEHWQDSLKSTTYFSNGPMYGVYYRVDKKTPQYKERPTNDILAGLTPVECSNGDAYIIDDYPMSPTEQAFKRIQLSAFTYLSDKAEYVQNVGSKTYQSGTFDEYDVIPNPTEEDPEKVDSIYRGKTSYSFVDFQETSSKNPTISFFIPNTLSGEYEIYLVTSPIWGRTGFVNGEKYEDDPRAYRFYAYVYERENDPAKNTLGKYPTASKSDFKTQLMVPNPESDSYTDSYGVGIGNSDPSDEKYFITDPTERIDTLYLGNHTFKNSYWARSQGIDEEKAGAMLQLQVQVSTKNAKEFSREMLISKVILKPRYTEGQKSEAEEANRR